MTAGISTPPCLHQLPLIMSKAAVDFGYTCAHGYSPDLGRLEPSCCSLRPVVRAQESQSTCSMAPGGFRVLVETRSPMPHSIAGRGTAQGPDVVARIRPTATVCADRFRARGKPYCPGRVSCGQSAAGEEQGEASGIRGSDHPAPEPPPLQPIRNAAWQPRLTLPREHILRWQQTARNRSSSAASCAAG